MLPKISVIMPNYNYAKFLEFSLGSICRQTIFPFECIVIDDASTDNSIQIIKKYKKLYPFIRLIENTSNQGAVNAIKLGLKASIGDYVCFFSSDDTYNLDYIEKKLMMIQEYPKVGLYCSLESYIDVDGNIIDKKNIINTSIKYFSPSQSFNLLKKGFFIAGHTAVINKKYLIEVGGFNEKMKWHCDWFAFTTIVLRYGFCYKNEVLCYMRMHKNTFSSSFQIWDRQKHVIKHLLDELNNRSFVDIKEKILNRKIFFSLSFTRYYFMRYPSSLKMLSMNNLLNFMYCILIKELCGLRLILKFIKIKLNIC